MHNLFGWSNATWLFLDQVGILLGDAAFLISFGLATFGWIRREDVRRWFRGNRFPDVGAQVGEDEALRWDGVVFSVSKTEVPNWVLQRVSPRAVVWVGTDQSRASVDWLRDKAREMGIRTVATHFVDPDDPFDAKRAFLAGLNDLADHGCTELAADITGGKTPMSLGGFMAAEEFGADTIYVASDFDARMRKPDMQTARILKISSPS